MTRNIKSKQFTKLTVIKMTLTGLIFGFLLLTHFSTAYDQHPYICFASGRHDSLISLSCGIDIKIHGFIVTKRDPKFLSILHQELMFPAFPLLLCHPSYGKQSDSKLLVVSWSHTTWVARYLRSWYSIKSVAKRLEPPEW